jgi:hypothetical protein
MPSRPPFRVLIPEDALDSPAVAGLGRQLQLLIAQGDVEFVRGIAWQVNARVIWLLEPRGDDEQAHVA